jgi:drug/metabolite transporter (DMT)-like permease
MKNGFDPNIGDFLVFGAAILWATQMTLAKKLTNGKQMNISALTIIQLAVVAVGSGVISLMNHSTWVHLTPSFWMTTTYLAIFATMFAFYIQLVMIRRTSPSRVALMLSSEPMFAAIFSILIMGEHLSFIQMIGGLCIVSGIILGRKFNLGSGV